MKLYITTGSPYARMARIVVIEKGLEDRVTVEMAATRRANSPYYRINPSGRVPYLVRDDGVGMEESALICRYLDHLDGKPELTGRRTKRVGRPVDSTPGRAVCSMAYPCGVAKFRGPKASNRPP